MSIDRPYILQANFFVFLGALLKFLRNSGLSRIICLLMAVHLLNACVDMPDAAPDDVPEDLSINDQESLVEIILEKGLNIENAIEEHDEADDTNTQNFEMCKDIKFQATATAFFNFTQPFDIIFNNTSYKIDYSYLYYKEINPPPPQA